MGRRISKTISSTLYPSPFTLYYVYDNNNLIAILDENNKLTASFTYGPGVDEPVIMSKADGTNYFYHSDALGSITYLTDEQGNIVESYEYSAYGVPTIRDKNGRIIDSSLTGNPFMFTGREYDSETGLYFYRARYYDPKIGRFISEDPIGFQGGDLNLYAYVRNNPVNRTDPYGEKVTITITRNILTDNAVIGSIEVVSDIVEDTFKGYTLEPIRKKGLVPAGDYDAFIRTDHNPNRIELKNVPGNENIQIHMGNSPKDTKGCFVVGETSNNLNKVGNSGDAMSEILSIIGKDASNEISVNIDQSFSFWLKSLWKNFKEKTKWGKCGI